jgi:hypothetical protein
LESDSKEKKKLKESFLSRPKKFEGGSENLLQFGLEVHGHFEGVGPQEDQKVLFTGTFLRGVL